MLVEAREFRAAAANLRLQSGTPLSSSARAEWGREIWEACPSKTHGVVDAVRNDDQTPFLSQDAHSALKERYKADSSSQDNVWVALLTPRLMELVASRSPNKLLINSERVGWIHTQADFPDFHPNPHLFVCDSVAYAACPPPRITDNSSPSSKYAASLRTDAFLFGACAWQLRDAVLCLMEAKVRIRLHEAIGEIFHKAQNVLRGTSKPTMKCCLFDLETMYLLDFTSSALLSAQYFPLTAPGSFLAMANFIFPASTTDPMWLRALRRLCDAFQVRPVQHSAFLGAGAHGKVFRVHSITLTAAALSESASSSSSVTVAASVATDSIFALKLVDRRHRDSLEAEHSKLQRLLDPARTPGSRDSTSCLPSFVSPTVHHVSDSSDGRIGAGLLLQPVGKWVWAEPPSNSKTALSDELDALVQLHRLNVIHGDARLENLIRVDARRLVWIDFRECELDASPELLQWWDLRACLNSFFQHHHRLLDQSQEAKLEGVQEAYAQLLQSDASGSSSQLTEFKQMVWDGISTR